MSSGRTLVLDALDALAGRDWDRFAAALHPDVVQLTPGVPAPVVGRQAFVQLSQAAVVRAPDLSFTVERVVEDGATVVVVGEWRYTSPAGPVRQPSVSVIQVEDGLITRDQEYFGLAM